MPELPDSLQTDNGQLWLLIGLCLAMVFTIEAVEDAVEGAWPHQRRPSRLAPAARSAQSIWGIVALLVLPGMLLAILNLGVMVWQDEQRPETLALGGLFVGVGWALFLLASFDRLPLRRLIGEIGAVAPVALLIVLIVGDLLLLIAFLDIVPSRETIRDAIPFIE